MLLSFDDEYTQASKSSRRERYRNSKAAPAVAGRRGHAAQAAVPCAMRYPRASPPRAAPDTTPVGPAAPGSLCGVTPPDWRGVYLTRHDRGHRLSKSNKHIGHSRAQGHNKRGHAQAAALYHNPSYRSPSICPRNSAKHRNTPWRGVPSHSSRVACAHPASSHRDAQPRTNAHTHTHRTVIAQSTSE